MAPAQDKPIFFPINLGPPPFTLEEMRKGPKMSPQKTADKFGPKFSRKPNFSRISVFKLRDIGPKKMPKMPKMLSVFEHSWAKK